MSSLRLWTVVFAWTAACGGSRVYYPFERPAYRVGDRSEMVVTIDSVAHLDDREFREHRHSKRRNEIVAMQGPRITAIRVELLEQVSIVDGVEQPAIIGAFVVESRDDRVSVMKAADSAPPSEREQAFVQAISEKVFRPPPATAHQSFELGKPVHLGSDAAIAFGLGDGGTADITLSSVTDDAFVVDLTGLEPPTGSAGTRPLTRKWSGRITISRHHPRTEHWKMEVELLDGQRVVGHSTQQLDSQLILKL